MKMKFMMLPCIAAVVIAAFVGMKTFESHAYETKSLLMLNIEALSQPEGEPYPEERRKCVDNEGNWNMASVCKDSGIVTSTCKISGEVTILGVVVKGSYEKGRKYPFVWARYACEASSGNCCKKQGVYSQGVKLD